jgi:pimeloyl-ACP methyl ester carboxylesterase
VGIRFLDQGPGAGTGAGLPLLLLHGSNGNWHHWRANVDALALHHRVIVPDMPGFGLSESAPVADLAGLSAALADLVRQLGLEQVALVGYSVGSLFACALASASAPAISRLLLINPPGWRERSAQVVDLQKQASIRGKEAGVRAGAEFTLRQIMLRNHQYMDEAMLNQTLAAIGSLRVITKSISRTTDLFALLGAIHCPWHVALSAEDPYHQHCLEERANRLTQFNGAPCVTVIQQARHWVQQDRPDAMNWLMSRFADTRVRLADLPALL